MSEKVDLFFPDAPLACRQNCTVLGSAALFLDAKVNGDAEPLENYAEYLRYGAGIYKSCIDGPKIIEQMSPVGVRGKIADSEVCVRVETTQRLTYLKCGSESVAGAFATGQLVVRIEGVEHPRKTDD